MAIFVNYDGPKLDKQQKQVVRSQVMVVVRGRQKQVKRCKETGPTCPSPPWWSEEAQGNVPRTSMSRRRRLNTHFPPQQQPPMPHAQLRLRILARKYLPTPYQPRLRGRGLLRGRYGWTASIVLFGKLLTHTPTP